MNPLMLLGAGLSKLSAVILFVKQFPLVWKVIKHRNEIQKILTDIWETFQSIRANNGVPSCDDTKKIIESVALIFEKDLIDLPELDEMRFADQLREVNALIICRVDFKPKEGTDV